MWGELFVHVAGQAAGRGDRRWPGTFLGVGVDAMGPKGCAHRLRCARSTSTPGPSPTTSYGTVRPLGPMVRGLEHLLRSSSSRGDGRLRGEPAPENADGDGSIILARLVPKPKEALCMTFCNAKGLRTHTPSPVGPYLCMTCGDKLRGPAGRGMGRLRHRHPEAKLCGNTDFVSSLPYIR